ncbi:negative regulator of sigmaE [Pasteurellaceae bacterium Macca]|nr:negative regulator of sigmaE [Pasteurellaceae bacterium Macca]
MKKFPVIFFLALFFSLSSWATSQKSPMEYLMAMRRAHESLNYELIYLIQQGEENRSLRYRHANFEGKSYAQLLQLDGPREEIILREDTVSYFGDYQPFSLKMSQILDSLPAILSSDFQQLTAYSVVDGGRRRIADRIARVIRIVPRDDFRYQYQLWIDEENFLLLRSDLLDRDNNILEQFRVLQSLVDEQFLYIVEPINRLILPTVLQTRQPQGENTLKWKVKWVPRGFSQRATHRQSLPKALAENETVESQFYSDGLFSFTVYVAQNQGVAFQEQFWREGKMSVYSQTVGDKDIIVIGDIPLTSARHIVREIELEGNTTP